MSQSKSNTALTPLEISRNNSRNNQHSPTTSHASTVYLYRRRAGRHTFITHIPTGNHSSNPNSNEVRQRVISARRTRIKAFQNQLSEMQQTINELVQENRVLRTLQRRQDKALAKYEATCADLPNLLRSHEEELRCLQTKCRNLITANRELEHKLKQKDAIVLGLTDQNKYFCQLNRNKNLEDRHSLTEKVKSLELKVQEKENDIRMMARRMQLETKHFKTQLSKEQKKSKEANMELQQLRNELQRLQKTEFPAKNVSQRQSNAKHEDKTLLNYDKDKFDLSESSSDSEIELSNHDENFICLEKLTPTKVKNEPLCTFVSEQIVKQQLSRILNKQHDDNNDADDFGFQANSKFENDFQDNANSEEDITNESFLKQLEDVNDDLLLETLMTEQQTAAAEQLCEKTATPEQEKEKMLIVVARKTQRQRKETTNQLQFEEKNIAPAVAYVEPVPQIRKTSSNCKTHLNDNVSSSIRKQISDDYKEREAFLDTFCRQANSMQEEKPTKRNSVAGSMQNNNVASRKHKLLAALRAIDDNKSQD